MEQGIGAFDVREPYDAGEIRAILWLMSMIFVWLATVVVFRRLRR